MTEITDIVDKLNKLESRIDVLEASTSGSNKKELIPNQRRDISVREFLLTCKLENDVQKTLALAYYLEKYQAMEVVNLTDIVDSFRLAREKVPLNVNDKINMNIKKGHFAEAKDKKNGKKSWYVTNTGIGFIEKLLTSHAKP